MKTVCAWCNPTPNEAVSHGVCRECFEKVMAEIKNKKAQAVRAWQKGAAS